MWLISCVEPSIFIYTPPLRVRLLGPSFKDGKHQHPSRNNDRERQSFPSPITFPVFSE